MSVYGLDSEPLPDGATPLEAVTIVKCLGADGATALAVRSTEGLTSWEAVGMLTGALDLERGELHEGFVEEGDE